MANRKAPETAPKVNTDEKKTQLPNIFVKELTDDQFATVVRYIKRSELDSSNVILEAAKSTLKKLGVSPDLDAAVIGIPNGSNQFSVGTLVTWMQSVVRGIEHNPNHTDTMRGKYQPAIDQIIKIHATCVARGA